MNTDKKLVVAFAVVAIGLLLYPPTMDCVNSACFPDSHKFIWNLGTEGGLAGAEAVDLTRLALYGLALAIAAGMTYFIRKK